MSALEVWNEITALFCFVDCAMHVAAVEWFGNLTNFETLMSLGPVNKLTFKYHK